MTNFGVFMFPTADTIQPAELATAVEERGFESLFFPEHTHIPIERWTGEPPARNGAVTMSAEGLRPYGRSTESPTFQFAYEYLSVYDPFIAAASAAQVTERIKLGTAISLINEHHVITFAKELATLDRISQGRLIIGFGGGWFPDEMANHQIEFKDRWQIARERILAMRELWTQAEPEFHGEFVDFDRCWMNVKPTRKGGPPFLLGAASKLGARRVVEYCDGLLIPPVPDDELRNILQLIREEADRVGRSMDTIDLSTLVSIPDRATAEKLIEMGFTRLIQYLQLGPPVDVIPQLDRYAEIVAQLS